jgi:hypothetical protein
VIISTLFLRGGEVGIYHAPRKISIDLETVVSLLLISNKQTVLSLRPVVTAVQLFPLLFTSLPKCRM